MITYSHSGHRQAQCIGRMLRFPLPDDGVDECKVPLQQLVACFGVCQRAPHRRPRSHVQLHGAPVANRQLHLLGFRRALLGATVARRRRTGRPSLRLSSARLDLSGLDVDEPFLAPLAREIRYGRMFEQQPQPSRQFFAATSRDSWPGFLPSASAMMAVASSPCSCLVAPGSGSLAIRPAMILYSLLST